MNKFKNIAKLITVTVGGAIIGGAVVYGVKALLRSTGPVGEAVADAADAVADAATSVV